MSIEIEKDKHKEVCLVGECQLVKLYMREAKTRGFGVYLVFWFGGKDMSKNPTYCVTSVQELELALKKI